MQPWKSRIRASPWESCACCSRFTSSTCTELGLVTVFGLSAVEMTFGLIKIDAYSVGADLRTGDGRMVGVRARRRHRRAGRVARGARGPVGAGDGRAGALASARAWAQERAAAGVGNLCWRWCRRPWAAAEGRCRDFRRSWTHRGIWTCYAKQVVGTVHVHVSIPSMPIPIRTPRSTAPTPSRFRRTSWSRSRLYEMVLHEVVAKAAPFVKGDVHEAALRAAARRAVPTLTTPTVTAFPTKSSTSERRRWHGRGSRSGLARAATSA